MDLDEVAKHNKKTDCWVVLYGKVYDVTNFIDQHPGGPKIILKYAGKDATAAFEPYHSMDAIDQLEEGSYKGTIKAESQKLSQNPVALQTKQSVEKKLYPLWAFISCRDFEVKAKQELSAKALAYYDSGGNDHYTYIANAEDWKKIRLRPRVLRKVAQIDLSISYLNVKHKYPIFIAPFAMPKLAHPEAEMALCKGAGKSGIPYCVSSNSSVSFQKLGEASVSGQCLYYQLYLNQDRSKSEPILRKLKDWGYSAVFLTVDNNIPSKRDRDDKFHVNEALEDYYKGEEVTEVLGLGASIGAYVDPDLNWDHIPWIKKVTGLPVILKGIQCSEDAILGVKNKCDGIYVSNHGGRQVDTTGSTVEILMELKLNAPEVFKKCEVFVDGGINRGSDVVKALCLGCKGVGIGRSFIYSLHPHGSEGVARCVEILMEEMRTCMRLIGITKVSDLNESCINTRLIENSLPERGVIAKYLSKL